MQKLNVINVLYFAHVREIVGIAQESIDVAPGALVSELLDALSSRYDGLGPLLERCRVTLNGEFVGPEASLDGGGELVIIPPVSGGAGRQP